MMRTSRVSLFVFVVSGAGIAADTASAGYSDFPLESYKLPEFRYQLLTVSPGASLGNNWLFIDDATTERSDWSPNAYCSGTVNHMFRKRYTLSDVESATTGSFYLYKNAPSWKERGQDGCHYRYTSPTDRVFNYFVRNSERYRRYVKNAVFIEGMVSPSVDRHENDMRRSIRCSVTPYDSGTAAWYSYEKSTVARQSTAASASARAGIGAGWIAEVTAAAVALHMLDKVAGVHGKKPECTHEETRNFAMYIDRLKRRRAFDARLANIEDIDSLYAYCMRNGITEKETARLTMELNDIWNYGFHQRRYAGREVKLFPTCSFLYTGNAGTYRLERMDSVGTYDSSITEKEMLGWPGRLQTDTEGREVQRGYSYGMGFTAAVAKPLGRLHQLTASMLFTGVMRTREDTSGGLSALYYGSSSSAKDRYSYSVTYPRADGQIQLTYSYFPTIRTTVTLNGDITGSKEFTYRLNRQAYDTSVAFTWPLEHILNRASFNSGVSVDYYFSPRLSYYVGVWGRLARTKYETYGGLPFGSAQKAGINWASDFGVSAAMVYALF